MLNIGVVIWDEKRLQRDGYNSGTVILRNGSCDLMDIHEIIAAVVDESNHDWIHLIHHGGDGRLSHYDTFVKECSGSLAPAWLSVSSPSWTNIGNFDYADLRRVSTDLGLTPFASHIGLVSPGQRYKRLFRPLERVSKPYPTHHI